MLNLKSPCTSIHIFYVVNVLVYYDYLSPFFFMKGICLYLQIDPVWGWASPPLRLQLVSHVRSGCRMGEMAIGDHRPPSPARLSHTSDKHPKNTLTELNLLRRHRELCDVVLNVGSRKIFAHRVILSACSPYFR